MVFLNTHSHSPLVILTLVSFSSLLVWSQRITTVNKIHDLTVEHLHSSKELTVELFHDWMNKHNKVYGNTYEMLMRYENFKDSVHHVVERNSIMRAGEAQTKHFLGVNAFSDMTHQEFIQKYASCDNEEEDPTPIQQNYEAISCHDAPSYRNWATEGGVTSVKDQDDCGSCWTFSVTGALEWIHWNATRELVSLSEQQLVDCDSNNSGCSGGNTRRAYQWLMNQTGIVANETYPYEARMKSCPGFEESDIVVAIDNYTRVQKSDTALRCAVANQPISVSINAHATDFWCYKQGIYDGNCTSQYTTHAVLLVGYGSENNTEYWIVKNSWGDSWGENGYARIIMHSHSNPDNGTCAIHSKAYYPIIKKKDEDQHFGAKAKHRGGFKMEP